MEIINLHEKIIRPVIAWNIFKNNIKLLNINYYELLIIREENEIYLSENENIENSKIQVTEKNKESKEIRKVCNNKKEKIR